MPVKQKYVTLLYTSIDCLGIQYQLQFFLHFAQIFCDGSYKEISCDLQPVNDICSLAHFDAYQEIRISNHRHGCKPWPVSSPLFPRSMDSSCGL